MYQTFEFEQLVRIDAAKNITLFNELIELLEKLPGTEPWIDRLEVAKSKTHKIADAEIERYDAAMSGNSERTIELTIEIRKLRSI